MERLNIGLINQDLRRKDDPAYQETLLDMAAKINELQEQVEKLQNSLSEEIMARLAQKPDRLAHRREIVEDLGHGWQIERQPCDIQDTITMAGTPASSWLSDDWVTQYAAAVDG